MTPDTLWDELVTTALVGTERQAPALPGDGDGLAGLLSRAATADAETNLLRAAGALAVYRRAGWTPPASSALTPDAAPDEELRPCGPAAASHLAVMLGGQYRELLPEWLEAARCAHRRAPEQLLPALLDLGRQQKDLRAGITPVVGRRGAWLATQNPAWNYVSGEGDAEASWETGSREARRLLLQRLRERDPQRGRELLESTWEQETPEDRAAFLELLKDGLGMADEPFLEAALDDRRKPVRTAAAELLARLPESRLVQRMRTRVEPLVSFRVAGGLLGIGARARLEVTLPEAVDSAAVRDGVEPKKPAHETRFGERVYWLVQMLSAIPPSVWSAGSSGSPAVLIEAARKTDYKDALLEAWGRAAVRHRDVEWIRGLVTTESAPSGAASMLEVLPPAQRENLVRHWLEQGGDALGGNHLGLALIQQCRHPWTDGLSRLFIRRMRERVGGPQKRQYADWTLQEFLRQAALFVSPRLLPELADGWPEGAPNWEHWQPAVNQFLSTLRFRYEMLEEVNR